MKKLVSLLALVFLSLTFTSAVSYDKSDNETEVYVCTGKYSKKYHLVKNCRGLSNCKSEVVKVYKSKAVKAGKTLCGWED